METTTQRGLDIQFEIPAASTPHRKVNDKHEREILLSIRVVSDDDLYARHERICVQHPRYMGVGNHLRVRLTRECYRSNFWETRLTFEPLWKAVPDASKWERIPMAESWADAKAQIEEIVGELPIISDDDSLPAGQSATLRAERYQEAA